MNNVVVITGVLGGIGQATAKVFKEVGWHVVGIDRQEKPALKEVDRFIQADASTVEDMENAFAEIRDGEGRIDALVPNAAIQICKPLVETAPDEWDMVMANNLRSVYLAVRLAYPLMRGHGGAIINVSSVHAIATSANIAAYATSKGGILAMTRALAIELAPERIRVNAILPGAVDTPMLRAGLFRGSDQESDVQARLKALEQRTVWGRVGQPHEIAQAILFLADNERSSFITGQALVVDGGATTRLSTE